MMIFLKRLNLIFTVIGMVGLFYAYYLDNIKDMLLSGFICLVNFISLYLNEEDLTVD